MTDIPPLPGNQQQTSLPYSPALGSVAYFYDQTTGFARPVQLDQPLPVALAAAGSAGRGAANNATALPAAVGATVGTSTYGGGSGFAAYVLVATLPANAARFAVDVENISGQRVVVVRDDGTAAAGAAPANATLFVLDGGSATPSQGGSWASTTFKGRLQVWAASDPGNGNRPAILED